MRRGTALRTRPDGPATPWRLGRTMVDVVDHQDGWARVVYAEPDHDAPDGQGSRWPGSRAGSPATCWRRIRFELSWHRLEPPPDLVGAQADWLAEFRDRLS